MDSREIEAQIKGLLGLQLGGEQQLQTAEPPVPPGAYPRQKNRYLGTVLVPYRRYTTFPGSTRTETEQVRPYRININIPGTRIGDGTVHYRYR